MASYRRVAYRDRCQISAYMQAGFSVSSIGRKLGFHKSTIYRELRRNQRRGGYDPHDAADQASLRFRRCRRRFILDATWSKRLVRGLSSGLSPEQLSGRWREEALLEVSVQTLYNHIHRHGRELRQYLRRFNKRGAGRYRQKKQRSSDYLSIDVRPAIVSKRHRLGDWERDGMYVADRQQLLVFTDRKSRYTKIVKLGAINPKRVSTLTQEVLSSTGWPVRSITNDNGPEFRDAKSLPYKVYFCHPGKPHQRGTVENTIGLLRQYISRKTKLSDLCELKLTEIENLLNLRPRKCLDYKTPYEVFYNKSVALAL